MKAFSYKTLAETFINWDTTNGPATTGVHR